MPNPKKNTIIAKKIFDRLTKGKSKPATVDLPDYCYEAILRYDTDIGDLGALKEQDDVLRKVQNYFARDIRDHEISGTKPEYVFGDASRETVVLNPDIAKEIPVTRFLWNRRQRLLSLVNSLPWDSFERLSEYLLITSGLKRVKLTKRGQEGIDVCGLYDFEIARPSLIPIKFEARIVGQIKQRSTEKINPAAVRSFKEYCEDVKKLDKDISKDLPDWFVASNSPVLGLYITTYDYTRRAYAYAENEWLFLRKNLHVVECLIQSPLAREWVRAEDIGYSFNERAFFEAFAV